LCLLPHTEEKKTGKQSKVEKGGRGEERYMQEGAGGRSDTLSAFAPRES